MRQKVILHIDFDSFFASVEQQYNPLFRHKPLGVTATNGRTCIIAASREAKKCGIKSPSNIFSAYKLCPSLLLTSADFIKYFSISKKFLSICKDYSPFVELFSIDEVFMDITTTAHLFGGTEAVVLKIKARIAKEIGEYITASVGISYNKMLAKLASGLKKPNGLVEISKENLTTVYAQAQLTDVCGIGSAIKKRLYTLGVYTLINLQRIPLPYLIAEFGVCEGTFLYNIALGIDLSPVIPYTETPSVKSIGRNYCLPHNEYSAKVVFQNMFELSEELGIKLRKLHKKARTVGFSLYGNVHLDARKTYSDFTDSGKDIFRRYLLLLNKNSSVYKASILGKNEYIRQINVWVSSLEDTKNIPFSLLTQEETENKLLQSIDAINQRYGNHTIRNGFLLYVDKLTTVPNKN